MADMIRIKPAPGRNVRDPANRNRVMPDEGIDFSKTDPYWWTKIQRGDVVVVQSMQPVLATKSAIAPVPLAAPSPSPSPVLPISTAVTGQKPNSQE
jgi:hypothetical protein